MTVNDLTIREIKTRAVVAPLKRPVRTAVGTIPSAPLILIDVLTEQGSAGRSYIFAYTTAALIPLVRLVDEIGFAPKATVSDRGATGLMHCSKVEEIQREPSEQKDMLVLAVWVWAPVKEGSRS
jgi:hypothetical protein